MSVTGKWNVRKYAWWDFTMSKWQVPLGVSDPTAKTVLTIKSGQLLLTCKRTVVESFSLVQQPKATRVHVKGNSIAVVTKYGEKFRKFKMLFDSSQEAKEAAQCLRKFVKIGGDGSSGNSQSPIPNRETLPQILEQLMSSPHSQIAAPMSLPEDYPLESAVRLCILDPGFPSLVHRVEAIVNNYFQ